ncbi:pentapeptide repeat-containing protein [Nonomuraea deserti]
MSNADMSNADMSNADMSNADMALPAPGRAPGTGKASLADRSPDASVSRSGQALLRACDVLLSACGVLLSACGVLLSACGVLLSACGVLLSACGPDGTGGRSRTGSPRRRTARRA